MPNITEDARVRIGVSKLNIYQVIIENTQPTKPLLKSCGMDSCSTNEASFS
ncbi:hypothetical protein LFU01_17420 [Lysinibacillus fusiformis]|nr:hypothetical protein LFU01_17420 [Lysinibacillus fusiformis]